jgi:hypothetical protein
MNPRTFAAVAVCLLAATPASAHRVDEYLQATRLSIGVDRVGVEIDLTPGVEVASRVFGWIDTNHDGLVSAAESDLYARAVVRDLALDVDGAPAPLTFVAVDIPPADAMQLGTGVIRVRADAQVSVARGGHHRLWFHNLHRPESSVYLANTLVPDDARVHVDRQTRDREQRELSVDYDVTTSPRPVWWLLGGFAAIGVLILGRRASSTTDSRPY